MKTLSTAALLVAVTLQVAQGAHLRELLGLSSYSHRRLAATCTAPTPNTDYIGNDVANVPNRQASDCCNECAANPQCGAWSWSFWNGGTCWLKSSKGATATKSGVTSAVLTTTSANCPSGLVMGTDFVDNDIANVKGSNAGACCDICAGWPGCKAFSWTNFNGGTCWLKSAKGTTKSDPNVISGEAMGPPSNCNLVPDTDFFDNDIANVNNYPDPKQCCGVCQGWSGCNAFSWSSQNGGTCWLKSRKGSSVPKAGVVSCEMNPNVGTTCSGPLEPNKDYVDNDVGNVGSGDAASCCSLCKKFSTAKAFSWSNFNGGTCWCKSAKGTTITSNGVISAVISP